VRSLPHRFVRFLLLLSVLALGAGVLAACGSGSESPQGSAPSGGGGAFPVTVAHKYGTTEVPAAPQRVVSLGYTDQDALLALGVVPVAIREFTGEQPSATWPWARDRLNGAQPQVIPLAGPTSESLAALQPDLIVGISAGLTQAQYDEYSRIAPVIASPAGFADYGVPWQDATKLTGQAVGRTAEADKLVGDLEARIAQARRQNPQLEGRTIASVLPSTDAGGGFFVYGPQDLRSRFFASLGLTGVPALDQVAGDKFYGQFSAEQLGQLNQADIVALIPSSPSQVAPFRAQPGWQNLDAVKAGKAQVFQGETAAALTFSSVLSLPVVLDTVPQQLAGAVG
jgi:iron complex transport system substrate-binding protein